MFNKPIHLQPNKDICFLIINYPSGIKYTAQTTGIACRHPVTEGIMLVIDEREICCYDDCKYACWEIMNIMALKIELNKLFKNIINKPDILGRQSKNPSWKIDLHLSYIYELEIDDDRIDELTEGWWPVRGRIKMFDQDIEFFKGYIAKENCD